jgi:hypothetical protein
MCGMTDMPIAGLLQDLKKRGLPERLHMRDFHATILNLHGLDQNRLWFPRDGRDEELTDFRGNAIQEMPA